MEYTANQILNHHTDLRVFALDKAYCYIYFNEKHAKSMEQLWHEKIAVGDNILKKIKNSDASSRFKNQLDKTLDGAHFTVSDAYTLKGFGKAYYEAQFSPIDEQGNIVGVVVQVRDVTQKIISSEEVEQNERLLSSINKNIKEGIYRSTLESGLIYANETMLKMFGFSSFEELVNFGASKLYADPDERDLLGDMLLDHGSIESREVEFCRKDGSIFWGSLNATMTANDDGKVYFDGAIRDITNQREQQKKIQSFEALFNQTNDFLFISKLDGTPIHVNPQWFRVFDFKVADTSLSELIKYAHPNDQLKAEEFLKTIEKNGKETIRIEIRIKNKFDSYTWLELNSTVDKPAARVYTVARDITLQKEVKEREKLISHSLLKLSQYSHREDITFENFLKYLTKEAAEVLKIERFSFWSYNPSIDAITCAMLYDKTVGKHSEGSILYEKDYPKYFQAIKQNRSIAAYDAANSTFTSEFSANYLHEHNIKSMMDAQVFNEKGFLGVLCAEKQFEHKYWNFEEQNYIAALNEFFVIIFALQHKKRAEQKLKEREERLTLLAENSQDIITLYRNEEIDFISPSVEKILGYTVNEMLDADSLALIHPEDRDTIINIQQKASIGGFKGQVVVYRMLHKNGHYVWLESTVNVKEIDEQNRVRVLVTRDITERKKQQDALEKSEQLFKTFADNLPGMVYIKQPQGKHEFANQKMLDYFDLTLEEYRSKDIHDLLSEETSRREDALEAEIMKTGESSIQEFYESAVKIWVEDIKFKISDELIGGITFDITHKKQIERALAYESSFHRLLMDISLQYINVSPKEAEVKINSSLKELGMFVQADRVYIFDYLPDQGICRNTYEWCNKGVNPEIDNLQAVHISEMPGWWENHSVNKPIVIKDVRKAEEPLRDILEPQGIKSLITVPIYSEGKCLGFVGFDSVEKYREYSQREVSLLVVFAQLLVNIFSRVRTQKALERSETMYRFLAEKTSDTVLLSTIDRKLDYLSPKIQQLTGYTPEEFVNLNPDEYIYPEDRPYIKNIYEEIRKGRDQFQSEYRIIQKSGAVVWIQTRTNVIRDENNFPVNMITTANDITDRKMAEQALMESEERYRLLTESAPVGIVVQTEGTLKYANPYAIEVLGYAEINDEILKNDISVFLFPSESKTLGDRIRALTENSQAPFEEILKTKEGNPLHVFITGIGMQYDGQPSICYVFSDISDIKHTKDNLQKALSEKEFLFRELHHRIKNNLQLVSSLLFIKSTHQKDPDLKKFIDETSAKILSIAQIHDQLLILEEVNQLNIKFYIEKLVENLIRTYQSEDEYYPVEMKIEEIIMDTDVVLVIGLFVNEVVSNIVKHAYPNSKGGPMHIELRKEASEAVLMIKDEGIGIPESYKEGRTDSYGMQLIHVFSQQLKAKLEIDNNNGAIIKLTFSIPD